MADAPTAYPLAWPVGWRRTPPGQRAESRFRSGGSRASTSSVVRLTDARERLQVQLDRLRAGSPILSTNLSLRLDGQPRADQAQPSDPGAACYFRLRGRPMVLACDRWTTVASNVAAIAGHIDAMRGMDRWGVGSVEQVFAGYAALPAPMVPDDWRSVLGNPATLAEAEATYRREIRTAHPDAGGSHARAATLNAAWDQARKALR